MGSKRRKRAVPQADGRRAPDRLGETLALDNELAALRRKVERRRLDTTVVYDDDSAQVAQGGRHARRRAAEAEVLAGARTSRAAAVSDRSVDAGTERSDRERSEADPESLSDPGDAQKVLAAAADSSLKDGDGGDSLLAAVGAAIAANDETRSEAEGRSWRSPAWTFCQQLRQHPELVDLDADAAADLLEDCFAAIDERGGLEYDGDDIWSRALGDFDSAHDDDEAIEDFLYAWGRVNVSPLDQAMMHVRRRERYEDPEAFGPELASPIHQKFRRFLALARECCRVADERGDDAAPLPVVKLARALGTHRKSVERWRRAAVELGLIEKVNDAVTRKRAAEYRWRGGR